MVLYCIHTEFNFQEKDQNITEKSPFLVLAIDEGLFSRT